MPTMSSCATSSSSDEGRYFSTQGSVCLAVSRCARRATAAALVVGPGAPGSAIFPLPLPLLAVTWLVVAKHEGFQMLLMFLLSSSFSEITQNIRADLDITFAMEAGYEAPQKHEGVPAQATSREKNCTT